ncbi:hypothetical protein Ciccas_012402 [Cichlidogyrus casuarinus]|uniref:Transposase n=1 Tax=Cichlidogyrus casuarinus TaxID=1844966 RepID=A0ABD2PRI7_9PLAT
MARKMNKEKSRENDSWSSKSGNQMFGISAAGHFDGINFHVLLNLIEPEQAQTGEYLAGLIKTCLESWHIAASKFAIVISDNGRNMMKAIGHLPFTYQVDQDLNISQVHENDDVDMDACDATVIDLNDNQFINSGSESDEDLSDEDDNEESPLQEQG